MKVLALLFCLNSFISFSQHPSWESCPRLQITSSNNPLPGDSSYIRVQYDRNEGCMVITFKSAPIAPLLDSIAKQKRFYIENQTLRKSPVICSGTLPLHFDPLSLIVMISEKYYCDWEELNKGHYIVKERSFYFNDLIRFCPYTISRVKQDSSYTRVYYDTLRNYFVIDFKNESPYVVLKHQNDSNHYDIRVDRCEDQKPNYFVSGTLPLYIKPKLLLQHFCFYHKLNFFKEGKMFVVTPKEGSLMTRQ